MKILLVGEYSRLHNSLKEGLTALGHEVTLIATGDYFKNYPADIKLIPKYRSGWLKKLRLLWYFISGRDCSSQQLAKQFFSYKDQLQGYDVVQLINESPLGIQPREEKKIISFLKKHNQKIILLCCGTDYVSVKYAADKKFRYSILSPYLEGRVTEKQMEATLKYLTPLFVELHHFVLQQVAGVIASDLDYHLPWQGHPRYLGLIPNPINTDLIEWGLPPIENKLVIFHGVNTTHYYKKGNDFFDAALEKIQQLFPERVEIIRSENLPYQQYIELYNRAHILLDQVYAYDQGYNALEAMAKGKVVFTGAEQEWIDHYGLQPDTVAINALPDVSYLVAKLTHFIENPQLLESISQQARAFVEREHHYILIAQKYLEVYKR
jgi:glycosyltransferase involved in cell wall biosynthesis